MRRIDRLRLTAWRWLRWGRRLLALGLLGSAVALAATEQERVAAAGPTTDVLVAAHDLAAGSTVVAGDLRVRAWPVSLVPVATLTPADDPVGRLLVGAIRAGEAVTDVRLLGPGLVEALGPDLRAVPVRLTDADVVPLLRAGDRIDVYAVNPDSGAEEGSLVAPAALVLAVPAEQDSIVPEGGIVVVAVPDSTASDVLVAAYTGSLAATLAPP